jgi:hypothetical protein
MTDVAPDESLDREATFIAASFEDLKPSKYTMPDRGDKEVAAHFVRSGSVDNSPAKLSNPQRVEARAIACDSALLMLDHQSYCQYTQGDMRWEGISHHLLSQDGQYPEWADCSSSYTWFMWNALRIKFGVGDVINGLDWEAGYTGTIVEHGLHIGGPASWMRGDALLYGDPIEHVAMNVGWDPREKYHMVIDCGSEAGPFYLRWNYRPDFNCCRRFI